MIVIHRHFELLKFFADRKRRYLESIKKKKYPQFLFETHFFFYRGPKVIESRMTSYIQFAFMFWFFFFLCFFPSQKPMLLAQENEKCIIFQELFFFSFSSLDYKGGRLGRRSKGKVGHENTRVAFSNRMFTKFN